MTTSETWFIGLRIESRHRFTALFALLLAAVGCSGAENNESLAVTARQAIGEAETVRINFPLPSHVPPTQVALAGRVAVSLNDRAVLRPLDSLSPVMTADLSSTVSRVGVDAVAGHVLVNSPLAIANRAAIRGSVYYSLTLEKEPEVAIFGAESQFVRIPMESVTLAAFSPPTTPSSVDIEVGGGDSVTRGAGSYRNITVRAGGTLTIKNDPSAGGEFFVQNLTIESNGKLIVNTEVGPVRMYVSGSTIITNGKVIEDMGSQVDPKTKPTKFLLVSQSTTDVYLNDEFHGVVIAEKAKISATGFANNKVLTHRGALFGNAVEVHQGAKIITGFDPELLWKKNVPAETSGVSKNIEKYVPNLGFLDGTNCERWPKSLTPAEYVPLMTGVLGPGERTDDVSWLNQQLQAQNIAKITAIGSSRNLVVTSYVEASAADGQPSRRWIAVDTEAGTAYDLSYQRLCTAEDMSPSEPQSLSKCSRRWQTVVLPSQATPVKLEVLGLTTQRERVHQDDLDTASLVDGVPAIQVPTVLLVAPKVQFQPISGTHPSNRVDLNVNLIVAAQSVTAGTPEGTPDPRHTTTVEVKPYVRPVISTATWRSEIVAPPRSGLVAIFAQQVSGLRSVVANDGVRISRLSFVDGTWPYNTNLGLDKEPIEVPTVWRFDERLGGTNGVTTESFELLLPKSAAFTWSAGMFERGHGSNPEKMPSYWCENGQPYLGPPSQSALCSYTSPQVQITLANVDSFVAYDFALNRFEVSRDYAEGGVALLSAGAGASDVIVRAPAAAPITANPELLPTAGIPDSMRAGCATEGCATVGYRVAESKIPGKVTFADPRFRSVEAGIPWCATTVVGHSAGPWGGYFEVDLDCHSIAMVEFWLGGDSKVASSSNRNVVAQEMTSFIDAALQTFWALPATAAPVEKTRKSEDQLGAQVGAQIVSNGLYFDTIHSKIHTASLKQAVPVAEYSQLQILVEAIDPMTTGQMRISIGDQVEILRTSRSLSSNNGEHSLNALNLPYGQFAAPWYGAWAETGAPYLTLGEVQNRWASVSAKQVTLADYVDKQDTQGEIAKTLNAVREVADALVVHGKELALVAENSSTAHAKVADSLKETASSLQTKLGEFQASFGKAIGCDGCDWNAIAANVQSTAQVIMDKCKENNAQNPWTVLDAVTKLAPFVSGAAGVLGGIAGQLDEASKEGGFLYALQYIQKGSSASGDYWKPMVSKFNLDKVASIANTAKGISDGIEKAASAAKDVAKKIDPINSECPVNNASSGAVKALLAALVNAQTSLDLMTIQAKTISGILSSIAATGENYFGEKQTNLELVAAMQAIKNNGSFTVEEIKSNLQTRAVFIEAACQSLRQSITEGSKDLYAVSAMLQTSAGRAQVRPELVIPAQDVTWNVGGEDKPYPYLSNVWDSSGLVRAFDVNGSDGVTSFIEDAQARFSNMLVNNICRLNPAADSRPPTGFVVRKVLHGEELEGFFANGSANFKVGLAELAAGGENSIDRRVTGVMAFRGTEAWDVPLAAPIVLGTRYTTCTGSVPTEAEPDLDPCCSTCRAAIDPGTDLSLIRYGDALIPSECDPNETPAQALIDAHGVVLLTLSYNKVVRTCLHAATTPVVSQATHWIDATVSSPYTTGQWKAGTDDVCMTYGGTALLVGLRGTPLMGDWTLANSAMTKELANRWSLGAETPVGVMPIAKPAGVTAIEVLFFVAAEPKPLKAPANYVTLDPATLMNSGS